LARSRSGFAVSASSQADSTAFKPRFANGSLRPIASARLTGPINSTYVMVRIINVCTEPNRPAIVIQPLTSRRPGEGALSSVMHSLPFSRSLLRLVALWSEAVPIVRVGGTHGCIYPHICATVFDFYLFFPTLEYEMKSNCRYGKNHSFGKNFFPSKEIYFTLLASSERESNPPGSRMEADPKVVGAIGHLSRESIRPGEKDSGGSSQERECPNG
jgi:hypothetical protein